MFIRSNHNKAMPEKIEMKNLPSQTKTLLPSITFDISKITMDLADLNTILIVDESNRTSKKNYTNIEIKNEKESSIRHILDDHWTQIFSYLDPKSLLFFSMLCCKKIAILANNDAEAIKRLDISKQNHLIKSRLSTSTRTPLDKTLKLFRVQPSLPAQQQLAPIHQTQEFYNDNPPGKGFVMR